MSRLRRPLAAAAFVAALGAAPAACGLMVPGRLGTIRCDDVGHVGPPACPSGQYCVSGVCVACLAAEVCGNGMNDNCDPAGLVDEGCQVADAGHEPKIGDECARDEDCPESTFCLDPAALGDPGRPSTCSRGCCTSADCGQTPNGVVCWPTPNAGAVCRRASHVARAQPGSRAAGEPCQIGTQCRSGACDDVDGVCADTCCSDSPCTSTVQPRCTFHAVAELSGARPVWACGPSVEGREYLRNCDGDGWCESNFCNPTKVVGFDQKLCSQPCCASDGCGEVVVPWAGMVKIACGYLQHNQAWARACSGPVDGPGKLDTGKPCSNDGECRSNRCATDKEGPAFCTDACCADADCGDLTTLACRPGPWGSVTVLRCEPR